MIPFGERSNTRPIRDSPTSSPPVSPPRSEARPNLIVMDTPPLPQRTVRQQTFVPFETDKFAAAHDWACEQLARKHPGSIDLVELLKSLISQKLKAE